MRRHKTLRLVIAVLMVTLFLVECGAPAATTVSEAPAATLAPEQPSATSTPLPPTTTNTPEAPTATPVPPTATPSPVPPTATPGFKDPSQCPDLDPGLVVPERLPNTQWSTMDRPSDARVWAIDALSVDDAWAIDLAGNILHFDGSSWTIVHETDNPSQLRGLFMISPSEGWAVGYETRPEASLIFHYADGQWSLVSKGETTELWDVDFVEPSNGWAVGRGILHYDGSGWATFSSEEELDIPPRKQVHEDHGTLSSVDMVSADEGWAVGDSGTILHYQRGLWQRIESPVETDLDKVLMISPTEGWIIGGNSTVLHFDGSDWSTVAVPTEASFSAVAADNEGAVWVVGEVGLFGGNILLRFDGQTWIEEEMPDTSPLERVDDIDTSANGMIWLVGDGLIARREFLSTEVPLPSSPVLDAIVNGDGDGDFEVSWESVPGIVKYVVEEANESRCPVVVYYGSEISTDILRKDVGEYHYRVRAIGLSGRSEWSEAKSAEVTVPLPPCALECTGSSAGMDTSLEVRITCESGKATQTTSTWRTFEEGKGWVTNLEGTRTYEDTGHEYEMVGSLYLLLTAEENLKVVYHVEVTGGVFGETPQVCASD